MRNYNYFRKALAAAVVALAGTASAAADDYPDLYITGHDFPVAWDIAPEQMFARDGNRYSLQMSRLSGEFKVRGTTWDLNLGAEGSQKVEVDGTCLLNGVHDGPNFKCTAPLENVTISFSLVGYDPADGILPPTTISIAVGGDDGDVRVPSGMSGTLPVLYINIWMTDEAGEFITTPSGGHFYNDEVIDRNLADKDYRAGEYWLDMNGCTWMGDDAKSIGSADEPLPLEMKARGNYTRTAFAKKPFKLKLGKKQNLLGLTPAKSKHYALLAHADDSYGFMRNFTGFSLGRRIGLPWTPAQQPVEVVINGDYRGLYFLTESIRVGDGRVEIEELADNAIEKPLISGGYLVELDNYLEENQIRIPEKSCVPGYPYDCLYITWDTPEEYSDVQLRFVTDQFTAMNDYVGANSNSLWSYIDLDDAARYYIVEEIVSHTESFHGSTYMFRDRGEGQKWHFSPLWDFGNAFSGPTNGYFYEHTIFGSTWVSSFARNAMFSDKVRQTWLWFMSEGYQGLTDEITEYADAIGAAAVADANRWRNAPVPDGGRYIEDNSDMASRLNSVLSHLSQKTSWLKSRWGDYSAGIHAEPARDTTPAVPLPDYAGIDDLAADAADADMPAAWFDLQGRPLAERPAAGLFIEKRGPRATLVRR